MGALTAQLGPRMRVLGDKAGFTKYGLDGQEDALREGSRPGGPDWGVEPSSRSGQLGVDGDLRAVTSVPGAYQDFYARMRDAVRGEGHVPVTPEEAIAVLEVIEQARSVA